MLAATDNAGPHPRRAGLPLVTHSKEAEAGFRSGSMPPVTLLRLGCRVKWV